MSIVEIKAKRMFAGPGNFAYIAEARVMEDDSSEVYVTVNEYDGEAYTVQDGSIYAFIAEDNGEPCENIMEEYESFRGTQKSKYAGVFKALKETLSFLG